MTETSPDPTQRPTGINDTSMSGGIVEDLPMDQDFREAQRGNVPTNGAGAYGNADDAEDADMLGDDTEDVADGATGMGMRDADEEFLRDNAPEDDEEDDDARPVDALIGEAMYRDATGASAKRETGTGGVYDEGDEDTDDKENFEDENEYTARRFSEAVGE